MKNLFVLLAIVSMISCNTQPVPVYQSPPPVVQQPLPYEIYQDGNGGQVVYYHDPNSGFAYYLEYSLFMSMWNSPNRYYTINHYYVGHRAYIDHSYSRYHSIYTRPSSTTISRGSNNNSAPSRPSSTSIGRSSSPTSISRPSAPMRSSAPSSSRSSFRSSSPGGRRH